MGVRRPTLALRTFKTSWLARKEDRAVRNFTPVVTSLGFHMVRGPQAWDADIRLLGGGNSMNAQPLPTDRRARQVAPDAGHRLNRCWRTTSRTAVGLGILVIASLLVSCSTEPEVANPRLSGAGEGCTKTADCKIPLVCLGQVCKPQGSVNQSDVGEAETSQPDAGPDAGVDIDAGPDPSSDGVSQFDASDSFDTCTPECGTGACVNGCGGTCPGACDDGNACTVGDACKAGSCVGTPKECDDGKPCTDDGCDANSGCTAVPNNAPCDDGSSCTAEDSCQGGACEGKVVVCDDNNPCTDDDCEPTAGCKSAPNSATCDDSNKCTKADICASGSCSGVPIGCDDGNPCTDDACAPNKGCTSTPNNSPCSDGNPCTSSNLCVSGTCNGGILKTCKPTSSCFAGNCSPVDGKCKYTQVVDGTSCSDASACSIEDACKGGACVGKPTNCDDGNKCTKDGCTAKSGCTHLAVVATCKLDDNDCTVEKCINGGCKPAGSKVCDDLNPCTVDTCLSATGACKFDSGSTDGKTCDADGSVCTVGDGCSDGQCKPGKPMACDDGNVCLGWSCDAVTGCKSKDLNGAVCDADGDACTVADACNGGTCQPGKKKDCGDNEACTLDGCDKKTSSCSHSPLVDATPCDADGSVCTVADKCKAGKCLPGTKQQCDDGNDCTADSCNSKTGCGHTGVADGSDCAATGKCKIGKCQMPTPAIALAAGGKHTCAVLKTGALHCWGENYDGQLGDNTKTSRSTPKVVFGLSTGVSAVATGSHHTCALLNTGAVHCWGSNGSGELGNGSKFNVVVPVPVVGLKAKASAISAGPSYTCALLSDGSVSCWGRGDIGQVGNGGKSGSAVPVQVVGLKGGVKAIVSGQAHNCALLSGNSVRCWGYNSKGQLGDGTTKGALTPVVATGLNAGVVALAAGNEHTCALLSTGAVKCWGSGYNGQLGTGKKLDQLKPGQAVAAIAADAVGLSSGQYHTCAALKDGSVRCWGGNSQAALGDGTLTERLAPVKVVGLPGKAVGITAGQWHTCALLQGGGVACWGKNLSGQTGDGKAFGNYSLARASVLPAKATDFDVGNGHVCASLASGKMMCWGLNQFGQVGDGSKEMKASPAEVPLADGNVISVGLGGEHTCAVQSNGAAHCWGHNKWGRLGDGTEQDRLTPWPVAGLNTGVVAIAAGLKGSCALLADGSIKCWGSPGVGKGGAPPLAPQIVKGLGGGAKAISVGGTHACALLASGSVQCWGLDSYGALGTGSVVGAYLLPSQVKGLLSGVSALSAGYSHSCAVLANGAVKCWGANGAGSIGDGTTIDRFQPVQVLGIANGGVDVSAGSASSCAVLASGAVKCWGANSYAKLGIGDVATKSSPAPVKVVGITKGAVQVEIGQFLACARLSSGAIHCWGLNQHGGIGDGSAWKLKPVLVKGFWSW